MNAVNLITFPDGDADDVSARRFALRQAHAALTQARQTATEASQADTRAATVLAAIQSELSTHVETCADLERQHAALLADQLRGNSDITNEDADAIEELADKLADAADARAEVEIRHNSMQRAADQLRSELKAAKTAVVKAEADVRQAAQELLRSEAERLCDEYLRLFEQGLEIRAKLFGLNGVFAPMNGASFAQLTMMPPEVLSRVEFAERLRTYAPGMSPEIIATAHWRETFKALIEDPEAAF